METFLTFAAVLGLCFLGLGVKIFFSKSGKFPETEIGRNAEMRKRGIRCTKQEEVAQWKRERGEKVDGDAASCEGCGLAEQCDKTIKR